MPWWGSMGPAMGLLHMGQTQRTSSHFTRHLQPRNREREGVHLGQMSPLPF